MIIWLSLKKFNLGTESVLMTDFQGFLRKNHEDDFSGQLSFLFGKSIAYQRIEAF